MISRSILDSFNRVNDQGNNFWDVFYQNFVLEDPRISEFFQNSNIDKQIAMMATALSSMVLNSSSETNSNGLLRLIEKHNHELRIPKDLFEVWADCLLKTLELKDPEFNEPLKQEWQTIINAFIEPFGV